MIGDLFDSPWKVLIVAVVLIVLFGSKKLPDAARSLGRAMRILKKEVSDLHHDEPGAEAQATAGAAGPAHGGPGRPSQSVGRASANPPARLGPGPAGLTHPNASRQAGADGMRPEPLFPGARAGLADQGRGPDRGGDR